jgi:hypothetical protein
MHGRCRAVAFGPHAACILRQSAARGAEALIRAESRLDRARRSDAMG